MNARPTTTRTRCTARRTPRPHRVLRLIDAENLAGTGKLSVEQAIAARALLDEVLPPGPHDHTVVAADGHNAFAAGIAWSGAQLLIGHGADGADLALLEWADVPMILERFDEVIVGSGDFAFISLVAALRHAGMKVTVASLRRQISGLLYAAATDFVAIDVRPATSVLIDLTTSTALAA